MDQETSPAALSASHTALGLRLLLTDPALTAGAFAPFLLTGVRAKTSRHSLGTADQVIAHVDDTCGRFAGSRWHLDTPPPATPADLDETTPVVICEECSAAGGGVLGAYVFDVSWSLVQAAGRLVLATRNLEDAERILAILPDSAFIPGPLGAGSLGSGIHPSVAVISLCARLGAAARGVGACGLVQRLWSGSVVGEDLSAAQELLAAAQSRRARAVAAGRHVTVSCDQLDALAATWGELSQRAARAQDRLLECVAQLCARVGADDARVVVLDWPELRRQRQRTIPPTMAAAAVVALASEVAYGGAGASDDWTHLVAVAPRVLVDNLLAAAPPQGYSVPCVGVAPVRRSAAGSVAGLLASMLEGDCDVEAALEAAVAAVGP